MKETKDDIHELYNDLVDKYNILLEEYSENTIIISMNDMKLHNMTLEDEIKKLRNDKQLSDNHTIYLREKIIKHTEINSALKIFIDNIINNINKGTNGIKYKLEWLKEIINQ